jgi:hypothetical protein
LAKIDIARKERKGLDYWFKISPQDLDREPLPIVALLNGIAVIKFDTPTSVGLIPHFSAQHLPAKSVPTWFNAASRPLKALALMP